MERGGTAKKRKKRRAGTMGRSGTVKKLRQRRAVKLMELARGREVDGTAQGSKEDGTVCSSENDETVRLKEGMTIVQSRKIETTSSVCNTLSILWLMCHIQTKVRKQNNQLASFVVNIVYG